MNRLFRTSFIFLLLLSGKTATAQPTNIELNPEDKSGYSQNLKPKAFSHSDSLAELLDISEFSHEQFSQPFTDFDTLYAGAEAAQEELAKLLSSVNQQTHTRAIIPSVKSYQRAQQKVANKFNGDASQLTDLARASIVADDIHQLMASYKLIAQSSHIVKVKNRFANPKLSGYRDINLLLELPQTKMIVELQLHLNDIAEIKSGPEHEIYEQVQQISRLAQQEQRELTELEQAKVTRLQQESHKLYHKTWLKYKRQTTNSQTLLSTQAA